MVNFKADFKHTRKVLNVFMSIPIAPSYNQSMAGLNRNLPFLPVKAIRPGFAIHIFYLIKISYPVTVIFIWQVRVRAIIEFSVLNFCPVFQILSSVEDFSYVGMW